MESAEELAEGGVEEEAVVAAVEVGAEEGVDGGEDGEEEEEDVDGEEGEGGGEVDGGADHGEEGQQQVGCQEVPVNPKDHQETAREVNKNCFVKCVENTMFT